MVETRKPGPPAAASFGAPLTMAFPGFLEAVNTASAVHLSGKQHKRDQVVGVMQGLMPLFTTGFADLRRLGVLARQAIDQLSGRSSPFGPFWTSRSGLSFPPGHNPENGVPVMFAARVPEGAVDWPWTVAHNLENPEPCAVMLVPGAVYTLLGAWAYDTDAAGAVDELRRDLWGSELVVSTAA